MNAKILVCDDKELMRRTLADALQSAGYAVTVAGSARDALRMVAADDFDVLITDMKMPEMDGMELLERAAKIAPATAAIVVTAYATVESAVRAMKLGAFDYILKPFKMEQIEMAVERACRQRRLMDENERLRAELAATFEPKEFVGSSGPMKALMEQIRQVAPSRATALICGESGTGKECVASAIHRLGPRRDGPFVAVNCAALSAGILESELFGHEKGAFTGADRLRRGRFELADGGIILLDEISEIEPRLQAKLLRVLQQGHFERVGSSVTRKTGARVLATTNRDLNEAVENGAFRADLFFRLNVLPIRVPALREHKEDIPQLADYFLGRFARREGRKRRRLTAGALGLLADYEWPGNVRELENLMERLSVLDLPEQVGPEVLEPWLDSRRDRWDGCVGRVGMTMDEMERNLIKATLDSKGGHRAKTAAALGIGLRTLGMKIKKWGLHAAQPMFHARERLPA